jgi:hypothetical protein
MMDVMLPDAIYSKRENDVGVYVMKYSKVAMKPSAVEKRINALDAILISSADDESTFFVLEDDGKSKVRSFSGNDRHQDPLYTKLFSGDTMLDGVIMFQPEGGGVCVEKRKTVNVEPVAAGSFRVSGSALDDRPQVDRVSETNEVCRGNQYEMLVQMRQKQAEKTLAEEEERVKAIREGIAEEEDRLNARKAALAEKKEELAGEEAFLKKKDGDLAGKAVSLKEKEKALDKEAGNARLLSDVLAADERAFQVRKMALDDNCNDLKIQLDSRFEAVIAENAKLKAKLDDANALLDSNGAAALVEQCKIEVRATKCEMLELVKGNDSKLQEMGFKHFKELAAKDCIMAKLQHDLDCERRGGVRWEKACKDVEVRLTVRNTELAALLTTERANQDKIVAGRVRELGGDVQQVTLKLVASQKAAMGNKLMWDQAVVDVSTQRGLKDGYAKDRTIDLAKYKNLEIIENNLRTEIAGLNSNIEAIKKENAGLKATIDKKDFPTNDAYALYLRSDNRRLEAAVADAKENVGALAELCKAKGATWEEIGEAVSLMSFFSLLIGWMVMGSLQGKKRAAEEEAGGGVEKKMKA